MAETTTELEPQEPTAAPPEDTETEGEPEIPGSAADPEPASTIQDGPDAAAADVAPDADNGETPAPTADDEQAQDQPGEEEDAEGVGPEPPEQAAQADANESDVTKGFLARILGNDGSEPVLLSERYDVFPGRPIPELNTPSARAFEVGDRHDPGHELFALVTIPSVPVRTEEMRELAGEEIAGILPLVGYATASWPPLGCETIILIYSRLLGGRVTDALAAETAEFRRQDIFRRSVDSLASGLQQLAIRDITHRAIRPENIYFLDAEQTTIVLGDCLSAPSGFDQDLIFETIEGGMTDPSRRGWGVEKDDLYALGVVLAFWLLGRTPAAHLKPRQLLLAKMTVGTYQTLTAGAQLGPNLLDPLRGLLSDDPQQRWGFEQIELWLNGRRVSPIQGKTTAKSERGLTFGDFEHFTMRTLAYTMHLDRKAAIELIHSGRLEQWLSRGLEVKELAATVATTTQIANAQQSDRQTADEKMLAQIIMLLDPPGPIRYKDISFCRTGWVPPWRSR